MKTILLLGILFFLNNARGAKILSWQDCVSSASKNNLDVRTAHLNLESSENSVGSSRSGFFPTLTASTGYSYGNSSTNSSASGYYTASLTATEELFSGFGDKAKWDQANANLRGSQASLNTALAKTSYDLASAYATLLYSQKSIKLQQNISQRREENLKMVELRFQSGQENKGSVLLSKANLNQAQYEILQAKNGIQTYRAQLAKVLGTDDDAYLEVADDFPLSQPTENLDLKKLAVSTPDYKLAVSQSEAADSQVTLAQAGFYPTLSLTGSSSNSDTQWFPQSSHWAVGATLTFPLFSGFKDYYAVKTASASFLSAEANRINVSRQMLAKLRQSYAGFIEAITKLKVDESYMKAAETRAEISRNKYKNGLLTFDAWDIIENDLISRQKAFLQSQRDRIIAQANWEQAQGKGVLP